MEPNQHVFVSAFLCEKLLTDYGVSDEDKALSAIRLADTFIFELPENQREALLFSPVVNTHLVIIHKCEAARQVITSIACLQPDGTPFEHARSYAISLKGGGYGHILVTPISVRPSQAGVYWIEIAVDGNLAQRVPIEVRFEPGQKTNSPNQTP